jgi:radical SAM family RiPP maturation amino acid epimerase
VPENDSIQSYRAIFDGFTPEAFHQFAHCKRFLEKVCGDDEFRTAVDRCVVAGESLQPICAAHGIGIDATGLLPIFSIPHAPIRRTPELQRYPLAALWDGYIRAMNRHRDLIRAVGDSDGLNPAFDRWRARQIRRCATELGGSANALTHPVIAFELSEGCSVGCWFCGVSAERFAGYFPYAENAALWRDVLAEVQRFFGRGARTGFCYWGSDPSDNPDYPDFIADYHRIIGYLPQTTMAAPLKDLALTRRVLDLFDKHKCIVNRFSVLTRKQLRRIHATFTAEELAGVELVLQNPEARGVVKAKAGRAMGSRRAATGGGRVVEDHSTIACVSGFLVNMPRRTIRLITPTRATARWPMGYWVIATRRFSTAAEFGQAMAEMRDLHMARGMAPDDVLALRPDLTVAADGQDLTVTNETVSQRLPLPHADALARLLAGGPVRVGDALARLVQQGLDVLVASHLLETVFRSGLLAEDPLLPGIGHRTAALAA